MAAAAYALLIAVCTLTSGAPSMRHSVLRTPDSSTVTTVTGIDIPLASLIAARSILSAAFAERLGRAIISCLPLAIARSQPHSRRFVLARVRLRPAVRAANTGSVWLEIGRVSLPDRRGEPIQQRR